METREVGRLRSEVGKTRTEDGKGRDTMMCGDPKTWFPMTLTISSAISFSKKD